MPSADPYKAYNFRLELDSITRAAFQEVSGFNSEIDVTEYREGGENITPRKLPGMVKYANITIKWGVTDDHELYDWHRQWVEGDPNARRKSGSIILLDRQGNEKIRWNFINAWPTKWDGPDFNATDSQVAFQTIEIAHEGIALA
jgi:phage tail-like protein